MRKTGAIKALEYNSPNSNAKKTNRTLQFSDPPCEKQRAIKALAYNTPNSNAKKAKRTLQFSDPPCEKKQTPLWL